MTSFPFYLCRSTDKSWVFRLATPIPDDQWSLENAMRVSSTTWRLKYLCCLWTVALIIFISFCCLPKLIFFYPHADGFIIAIAMILNKEWVIQVLPTPSSYSVILCIQQGLYDNTWLLNFSIYKYFRVHMLS